MSHEVDQLIKATKTALSVATWSYSSLCCKLHATAVLPARSSNEEIEQGTALQETSETYIYIARCRETETPRQFAAYHARSIRPRASPLLTGFSQCKWRGKQEAVLEVL